MRGAVLAFNGSLVTISLQIEPWSDFQHQPLRATQAKSLAAEMRGLTPKEFSCVCLCAEIEIPSNAIFVTKY
jgi:hypothetical protein